MGKLTILFSYLLVAIINCSLCLAQSSGDYRSLQTGSWSVPSSWQVYNGSNWIAASAAPSAANGVITILSGHTINSDGAVTADQVVINSGGTLNIYNSSFTVNDGPGTDIDCNGTLAIFSNTTLNGAGSINVNSGGSFTWNGGTLGGSGILNIATSALLSIASNYHQFMDTRIINNYGTCTWTGNNIGYESGSPAINNYGIFNISTDGDIYTGNANPGTFSNMPGGVINKTGSPSDNTSFNNISNFTNAGTINVNASQFQINVNSIHTGAVNIAFGANMNFTNGMATFNAGTTITGNGNLNFDGNSVSNIHAGNIAVKNFNIANNNAVVTLTPNLDINNGNVFSFSGGTLNGTGNLNVNAGGTFNWIEGRMAGTSSVNINSGAVLNMSTYSHELTDTRTIHNYGIWNWSGGDFNFTGTGAVNNYAVLNINSDASVNQYNSGVGTFNNMTSGIINKNGSISSQSGFSITNFNNTGTINVNSGNIGIYTTSVHSGTYNIDFGGGLTGYNPLSFIGNSFTNNGYITINRLNFNGNTVQSLLGEGVINTLYINNPAGVLLTEAQSIQNNLQVTANSKLTVSRSLILQ